MKALSFMRAGLVSGAIAWGSSCYAETLEAVIAKVLAEHPLAQASMSRWQAQEELVSAARSSYWPSLDVATGVGKQRKNDKTIPDLDGVSLTRKEASFSVRQNLFAGFSTMNSVDSARQRSKAEQWRLQVTYEELALRIIDVYLKVLERAEHVTMAEDNLDVHNNIYQQIKKRATQGVASKSDLAQIEGRRARANANLISARNNLLDAESEYVALVGKSPEALELPGSYNLVLPGSLQQALTEVHNHHPGVRAAELEIESTRAQYKSLRSAHLPTLDVEIDRNWRQNADGSRGANIDLTAMLRLRYNLFRGGGDKARIQESAYRVEESRALLDRTLRNAEEKLRIAWAALEMTGRQKKFLKIHEKSSKETVAAYREQFNLGKRTLLDLLDGENELFQSSRSLTSAIYQEAFARYRILGATGQLLQRLRVSYSDGSS